MKFKHIPKLQGKNDKVLEIKPIPLEKLQEILIKDHPELKPNPDPFVGIMDIEPIDSSILDIIEMQSRHSVDLIIDDIAKIGQNKSEDPPEHKKS